jgi:conjugative relaxase-like TrwC/TraI family protein
MHGGVKVYRGAPSAARAYVEADRSRVDEYYLAEGTGLAERFTATPGGGVEHLGALDADGYEAWVAGHDPLTGEARGRLRQDGNAVRFVEITVNGPKTWSLAAALDPDVAAAYDLAQNRAAEQIIAWVAEHATTRIGPRGRQVQVPVERVEAVTVRHYTSRAGDPHRHLHLQVNARVFVEGKWRGLHTVGFRDSIEALNGIGHAAVMTDPVFRAALAGAGFTLDPATGEVAGLAPYVGRFSERAAQIGRNIDRYEAEWRTANPGQEPGPVARRSWDRRAWKDARPDKIIPTDGAAILAAWKRQLHDLGYRDPGPQRGLHSWWAQQAWVSSTVTLPSRPFSPGWVHGGRHGTPPTSAGRSRSGSRPPVSWLTPRSGSSWPKTSPPASSRRVYPCSTGRTFPSTSAPSPRRRCSPSRQTS